MVTSSRRRNSFPIRDRYQNRCRRERRFLASRFIARNDQANAVVNWLLESDADSAREMIRQMPRKRWLMKPPFTGHAKSSRFRKTTTRYLSHRSRNGGKSVSQSKRLKLFISLASETAAAATSATATTAAAVSTTTAASLGLRSGFVDR
jgi:hypothetical protein